jgi:hypothetical protein
LDRSLWLLMKLRMFALFRRWKKAVSKPKGIVLAVMSAMIFAPWLFSVFMTSRIGLQTPIEQIERFAPLGIFLFTVWSLMFSAGEQSLYYSPAEVTFLFAGPYRKRQLLGYKLLTTILLCLFSSAFFTLAGRSVSPRMISAFAGSFLLMLFLQTLQMVVGLAGSTLGAMAWNQGRRVILLGLLFFVAMALISVGRELGGEGFLKTLEKIERSSVAQTILIPFRWFVLAFTAQRIWPDLVKWASLCGLIDLGLLGLVFALDAGYLEVASSSSAKRFAKLKRIGGGGGGIRSTGTRKVGRFRIKPPNPPWWGGVGPNLWRQMLGAIGDPGRLAGVILMLGAMPIVMIVLIPKAKPDQASSISYACMGMIAWLSIVLSMLMPYDFRGDIDLMEELKGLPIKPTRLALGQLLTPTLLASFAQALTMLIVIIGIGGFNLVSGSFLAFLLPVNFLFYAVENLLFLWFPSRVVAGSFDVMAVGRQVLFMLAKVFGLSIGVGVATIIGLGVYFLLGRNAVAAIGTAWVVMVAVALATLPLVGLAFVKFDVSRDIPA